MAIYIDAGEPFDVIARLSAYPYVAFVLFAFAYGTGPRRTVPTAPCYSGSGYRLLDSLMQTHYCSFF